jgi:hypothetical protein
MMLEREILDPATYRETRRPLLEAETLPAECYTSEAFYRWCVARTAKSVPLPTAADIAVPRW